MSDPTVPEAIQELSKACANESARLLIANSELARLRAGVRDAVNQLRLSHSHSRIMKTPQGLAEVCCVCRIPPWPCRAAKVADQLDALIGGKP